MHGYDAIIILREKCKKHGLYDLFKPVEMKLRKFSKLIEETEEEIELLKRRMEELGAL